MASDHESNPSSPSEELEDCREKSHIFDTEDLCDRNKALKDPLWVRCPERICPNRYNGILLPLIQRPSFEYEEPASYQEDPSYDGSGPPLQSIEDFAEFYNEPTQPLIEAFPTVEPPSSPALSELSEPHFELPTLGSNSQELQRSYKDESFNFHILTTMSGLKDTSLPRLDSAAGYAEWATLIRGYLTFI